MTTQNQRTARARRGGCWPLSYVLPEVSALEKAPAMARAHTRDVLAQWRMQAITDTAQLVVTELITNVVQCPGPHLFRLELFSDRAVLLVQVWDAIDGVPRKRLPDATDESGRGLAIVEAVSKEWGTFSRAGGKVVYALLENAL